MAAPFVQGQLRNEDLEVEVVTSCAHCGREMHIQIDSELKYRVREPEAQPLIFEPSVDWATFDQANIIDGY
jgi:Zn ribbon nucleic-acid-binding protein